MYANLTAQYIAALTSLSISKQDGKVRDCFIPYLIKQNSSLLKQVTQSLLVMTAE